MKDNSEEFNPEEAKNNFEEFVKALNQHQQQQQNSEEIIKDPEFHENFMELMKLEKKDMAETLLFMQSFISELYTAFLTIQTRSNLVDNIVVDYIDKQTSFKQLYRDRVEASPEEVLYISNLFFNASARLKKVYDTVIQRHLNALPRLLKTENNSQNRQNQAESDFRIRNFGDLLNGEDNEAND